MGWPIVHHDADALGPRKVNIGEFAHAGGEVYGGTAVGDFDFAPGPMRVEEDEQVGRAVALVLAVVALDLPRLGRDRLAHLADELGRALIEADDRALRIGHFGIESSTSSIRATYSASTCGMHHMSLRHGLISFSASRRRTVSREMLSCSVSRTIAPASRSRVQRARPSGGLEQAVATSRASCLPESLRPAPGRGSSRSARSRLPSTKRRLVR